MKYKPKMEEAVEAWELTVTTSISITENGRCRSYSGCKGDFLVKFIGGDVIIMSKTAFLSKYEQEVIYAVRENPFPSRLRTPGPWEVIPSPHPNYPRWVAKCNTDESYMSRKDSDVESYYNK